MGVTHAKSPFMMMPKQPFVVTAIQVGTYNDKPVIEFDAHRLQPTAWPAYQTNFYHHIGLATTNARQHAWKTLQKTK